MLRHIYAKSWLWWWMIPGELLGALISGPPVRWGSVVGLVLFTAAVGLATAMVAALDYRPPGPPEWLTCPVCGHEDYWDGFIPYNTLTPTGVICPGRAGGPHCGAEFCERTGALVRAKSS